MRSMSISGTGQLSLQYACKRGSQAIRIRSSTSVMDDHRCCGKLSSLRYVSKSLSMAFSKAPCRYSDLFTASMTFLILWKKQHASTFLLLLGSIKLPNASVSARWIRCDIHHSHQTLIRMSKVRFTSDPESEMLVSTSSITLMPNSSRTPEDYLCKIIDNWFCSAWHSSVIGANRPTAKL